MQAGVGLHKIRLLFRAIRADARSNVRNLACIWPSCSYCTHVLNIARPLLLVGSELSPRFHFTPHSCSAWGIYQGAVSAAIVIAVDSILILRGKSIYSNEISH